jgi:hypothetical protein
VKFDALAILQSTNSKNCQNFIDVLSTLELLVSAKDAGVGEEALEGHWQRAREIRKRNLHWLRPEMEVVADNEGLVFQLKKLQAELPALEKAAIEADREYDAFITRHTLHGLDADTERAQRDLLLRRGRVVCARDDCQMAIGVLQKLIRQAGDSISKNGS